MSKMDAKLTKVSQFSGPLPPPESLIKYNEAVPNAAERIICMAEKEMQHRHENEKRLLKNRIRITYLSVVLSFISVIVLSVLVGFSLYYGASGTAVGVAIGAIASVAGLFVYAKAQQNKHEE